MRVAFFAADTGPASGRSVAASQTTGPLRAGRRQPSDVILLDFTSSPCTEMKAPRGTEWS